MDTKNLPLLKIHKLSKAQYERELSAGRIDENALYLTPEESSLTEEKDPTVPAWAKEATKPSYTADEVGALADTTVLADLTDDATHRTVTDAEKANWNAKSDFSGDYNDLENAPNITEDASNNLVITDPDGNIIFRSDANGFETTQLTTNTLIVNGVDVEDAMSLKMNVTDLPNAVDDALAQAKASGEFDGEDGYSPVRGTDYWTDTDKTEIVNDTLIAIDNIYEVTTFIISGGGPGDVKAEITTVANDAGGETAII